MKQHKWHKEIKAWADGAEIEWRTNNGSMHTEWRDVGVKPSWEVVIAEFRIKPQPVEPNFDATAYQKALKESGKKFKDKIEKAFAQILDNEINNLLQPQGDITMNVKMETTGDNDSLEDAMIAITNMKDADGKYLGFREAFKVVIEFVQARDNAIEQALKEKN